MRKLLLFVAVSALGLGLAGCGEEEVPEFPTYTNNVAPILGARCVRCHNPAVTSTPTIDADPYSPAPTIPGKMVTKETPISNLTTFEGAKGAKVLLGKDLLLLDYMPPAPSPPLTAREREILSTWYNSADPLP